MAFGPFRQMVDGAIMLDDQTAITGTSEAGAWSTADYTGFGANTLRAGQIWHLSAFGKITTAGASPGNITITPRYGTTTGGVSLGASTATALVASATNALWRLEMDFVIRDIGNPGANSKVVANGYFITTPAVIAASTGQVVLFGSNAEVSVDTHISAGIFMGITMGSASDSLTTMAAILENIN